MATHKNTQRFNCTACGATDDTARCLGNSTIHTGGRWMMPADFNRYMAARRPVDREAVAALRDANKSARAAIAATTDPTHLDTTAAPLHTTTAGDRDAYLARRAVLEDGTDERSKWARTLTSAAVDYLRTPDGDTDSAVAKEHVSDMIGQALHFIAGPGLEREGYTRAATRIETAAKAAA